MSEEQENPSEFIKKASEERARKVQEEIIRQQIIEQQAIQNFIDRKIRENAIKRKKEKKIESIEDALKKGNKIRWELINNNVLRGFVKNKFVFEIKRGLTIFNLYIKDNSLLINESKKGYSSCSFNLEVIKKKAENLLL